MLHHNWKIVDSYDHVGMPYVLYQVSTPLTATLILFAGVLSVPVVHSFSSTITYIHTTISTSINIVSIN